jgi:hypothetical protein
MTIAISPAWFNHRATKLNKLTGATLKEEAAPRLWALAEEMTCDGGEPEARRARCNDALTLYLGSNAHGTFSGSAATLSAALGALGFATTDPVSCNVIQYCVDTMASHLCRQKVRPLWVTEKGDPELQRKAKNIQMAIEGQFDTIGLYGMTGIELCYHGLLFEGAGLQAIPDYANNRVDHQIVWAHEFSVPVREARANNIRTWIRTYDVDRQVLLHRFRDKGEKVLDAIRQAPGVTNLESSVHSGQTEDRVRVREAWHLPSGYVDLRDPDVWTDKCEHDGRHVLCLEKDDLINEAWPLSHTLVAWFTPLKKPGSHWSRGIPATLASGQLKINEWNRRIDGILKLHAVPRLIVWAKAKLSKSKWTNDLASIITSSQPPGTAVMRLDAQSVPAELINRVDQLIAWCEKQVGLSELSIAAARPPGIDHAPGLQQLQDQESIRHTVAYRAWEQFHIDAARNEVEALRMLTRVNKKLELVFGNAKELQRAKWSEIDIERDRYQLRAWPTALLPLTPGARLSRAIDMLNSQLATPDEVLRMLDMPDVDAVMGDRTAESENIERLLDLVEDDGAVTDESAPHAYLNLEMALSMSKLRINRLEANGAPEGRIEGVRQFFEAVQTKITQAQEEEARLRALGSRVGGAPSAAGPELPPAPGGAPPDPMAAGAPPPGPMAAPPPGAPMPAPAPPPM